MKLYRIYLFYILVFLSIPAACQTFFNSLEDSVYRAEWINVRTERGDAHSGMQYAIATGDQPFGLGYKGQLPVPEAGTNTLFIVDGWVKSNLSHDKAAFVISLQQQESVLFWDAIQLGPLLTDPGKWTYFSDSLLIPAGFIPSATLKAYLWNHDAKDTIAIDDLRFRFEAISNETFLPNNQDQLFTGVDTGDRLLFSNDFYKIFWNESNEALGIFTAEGEPLIQQIGYRDHRIKDGQLIHTDAAPRLRRIKEQGKKRVLVFRIKSRLMKLRLEITCYSQSPAINFEIREKYRKRQTVSRESMFIRSARNVDEVYRANRKSDTAGFQKEYWLDRQGVKFGRGKESWFIYHQPGVSSLQLQPKANLLWVNLDYEKDHPFIHFPLNNDTTNLKMDLSASKYARRMTRKFSFSIHAGKQSGHLPRFMKNPSGYQAAYIWTEHADFTEISTNRASFFGSEDIVLADNANGGFVKYNIPVTKSVFYANPDSITNEEISNGSFTGLESTIQSDTAFHAFLKQLDVLGHEICLHTPEQFTSNRSMMSEALGFMQQEFGSPTWIDHGYNNLSENNREDLVCDGTIKKSEYYSVDLWKENGIGYLWNPYYEDYFTFDGFQFGQLLPKPHPAFGDHIPNPDYWQHFVYTDKLYHWPTRSVLYAESDAQWAYLFSETILDDLVKNLGVYINHCYPAWVDPSKGFWYTNEKGTITAREGFNLTLELMAAYREAGKLNITTVGKFMDYQVSLENVSYNLLPDGRIRLTNYGQRDITGLSMAVKSQYVLVDSQVPEQKIVGDDLIFWFDLPAKSSVLIRSID